MMTVVIVLPQHRSLSGIISTISVFEIDDGNHHFKKKSYIQRGEFETTFNIKNWIDPHEVGIHGILIGPRHL
jgi:hypothetical protein